MERLQRIFSGAGGMGVGHPPPDSPLLDSSEQVYISSLALLKMLKHGGAGVPMEVMGWILGEFMDEYTVRVVDVFAKSGTGGWGNGTMGLYACESVYFSFLLPPVGRGSSKIGGNGFDFPLMERKSRLEGHRRWMGGNRPSGFPFMGGNRIPGNRIPAPPGDRKFIDFWGIKRIFSPYQQRGDYRSPLC